MSATQIKKLNDFHEQLARWVLQNPHLTLREAAAEFGYSVTWLSIIMNTDAFRARLRELNNAANALTVADIPARLRGIATSALETLSAQLEQVCVEGPASRIDREFVKETADMALKALGYYSPQRAESHPTATVIYADKVLVAQARERLLQRGRTIDAEQGDNPQAIEVHSSP